MGKNKKSETEPQVLSLSENSCDGGFYFISIWSLFNLAENIIFRHGHFSGESYIFPRPKIAILQILKIYNIKTIFHQKRVHFKDFWGCMYVCCDQVTRLS